MTFSRIRCLDVETSGTDPEAGAEIVEIGAIDILAGAGRAEIDGGSARSSLARPERPIPPEIVAVHHIDDAMIADAPPLAEALAPFGTGADFYCAHNTRFERLFLDAHWPDARWIDTYRCALVFWPDAPAHNLQALRYWRGLAAPSDPNAAPPHRALPDAYVGALILCDLISTGMTGAEMLNASSRPARLPKFTFGKHAGTPIAEVPTDYLQWILGKAADFDPDVVHTARENLATRNAL